MSEFKDRAQPPEEMKLAMSKAELPQLQPDHVRVVHICHPNNILNILETGGLDYSKYGTAMSTARAWEKPEEVIYGSDDPRFSSPELQCAVFDMTSEEWNRHVRVNSQNTPPGIIPLSNLVGIIPANQ